MDTAPELFGGRAFEVFDASEINEVLLAIYRELSFAIREGDDSFILNHESLLHISHSVVSGKLPMTYEGESIYQIARKSLLSILDRDSSVQRFFQPYAVDDEHIEVRRKE